MFLINKVSLITTNKLTTPTKYLLKTLFPIKNHPLLLVKFKFLVWSPVSEGGPLKTIKVHFGNCVTFPRLLPPPTYPTIQPKKRSERESFLARIHPLFLVRRFQIDGQHFALRLFGSSLKRSNGRLGRNANRNFRISKQNFSI